MGIRSASACSFWLALTSACSVSLLCAPVSVRAQSDATLKAFQTEPHLGTAEDALVGLIVTNKAKDGSIQTRHANGLILRCDGFILAPAELFNTRNVAGAPPNLPDQSVTVVLRPGTDAEQRVPGHRPAWYGFLPQGDPRYHLRYAVFKMDNIHAPALRTLLPDSLQPGDAVQVVWSAWDEAAQRFKPAQTRKQEIGTRMPPPAGDKTPPKYREQSTPFAYALEAVPPGALVIGPEELAVGLVSDGAAKGATQFANFDSLYLATNCVIALPTSDAAFMSRKASAASIAAPNIRSRRVAASGESGTGSKAAMKPTASSPDMVEVPGGPVRLPTPLLDLQWDMERSVTACVAPFLIDRFEVTNEQYWAFWQSLSAKQRADANIQADMYPIGWGPPDAPYPAGLAQVPVLGVRLPGARAYAKWAGKRLPTPYEWCLAAFGPSGGTQIPEWGRQFLKDRQESARKIAVAHGQYAREHPDVLPHLEVARYSHLVGDTFVEEPESDGVGGYKVRWDMTHPIPWEFFRLPWYFYKPEYTDAAIWSHDKIEELLEPLFTDWIDPMYVQPVGSRSYDISPYGAQDMVMNAEELVAPGPFFPWNRPPAHNWPYYEPDRYMHVNWTTGTAAQRQNRAWGGYPELAKIYPIGGTSSPEIQRFMAHPETILQASAFYDNNMALWQNRNQIATPGFPNPHEIATDGLFLWTQLGWSFGVPEAHASVADHSAMPESLIAVANQPFDPLACLWENGTDRSNYTVRMPSRRIHSAAENARPGSDDYYPTDLGSYLLACASMDEYSELLRPADMMEVGLRVGPTYNLYPYPAGATTFHHRDYEQHAAISFPKRGAPRITGKSPPEEVDNPEVFPGTAIARTGSFSVWSGLPKHYHVEIGRQVGVDHARAWNPQAKVGYPIPDTFLVPGGFRCAR